MTKFKSSIQRSDNVLFGLLLTILTAVITSIVITVLILMSRGVSIGTIALSSICASSILILMVFSGLLSGIITYKIRISRYYTTIDSEEITWHFIIPLWNVRIELDQIEDFEIQRRTRIQRFFQRRRYLGFKWYRPWASNIVWIKVKDTSRYGYPVRIQMFKDGWIGLDIDRPEEFVSMLKNFKKKKKQKK